MPNTWSPEQKKRLESAFSHHFIVHYSFNQKDAPNLSAAYFRFRHRIYAEQMGFEPKRISQQEQDEFDCASQFVVIEHRASGEIVAGGRVIQKGQTQGQLPLEKIMGEPFATGNSQIYCEISRMAILPAEQILALCYEQDASTLKRLLGQLSLMLYFSSMYLAHEMGSPHCFLLAEPAFVRRLRMVGGNIKQIASGVQYRGLRWPCYIDAKEFLQHIPAPFSFVAGCFERQIGGEQSNQQCVG